MKKVNFLKKSLIFLFMLLLFLPMTGIFRENVNMQHIAETENRQIYDFPKPEPLSKSFYTGIENWFNDRILGRKDLISNWAHWNGKLFNVITSKEIVKGSDGYLFWRFATDTMIKDESDKIEQLNRLNTVCKNKDVRLIIMLAPPTEWILSDLLPEEYANNDYTKSVNDFHTILKNNNIEYLDAYSLIKNDSLATRKEMCVKNDYHWTEQGAFVSARALLDQLNISDNIKKDTYYQTEDRQVNSYTRRIGIEGNTIHVNIPWNDSFIHLEELPKEHVIDYTNKSLANRVEGQAGETIVTNNDTSNRLKILVIGDSYWSAMGKYVIQDTYQVIFSHNIDIRDSKKSIDVAKMIDVYSPDIVLYEKAGHFFFGYNYDGVFGTWAPLN